MSQTAKQSQTDMKAMSSRLNLTSSFDHAAGSSVGGSGKLTDIEARIEGEFSATMREWSSVGLLRSTSRRRATGDETEEYGADS
jgi:hypothetical protein